MAKKILEGLWDCPYCGQKAIGGLTKTCPNCAHPQDKDTVFYMGQEKKYLDEETAEHYGKGADWTCSFCGSMNRYDAENCVNCGAERAEADGNYFDHHAKDRVDGNGAAAAGGAAAGVSTVRSGTSGSYQQPSGRDEAEMQEIRERLAAGEAEREEIREARQERIREQKGRRNKGLLIAVCASLAFFLVLAIAVFMPRNAGAEVSEKSWERNIAIEDYITVQEDDWSVPEGGRVTDERSEIQYYDHVLDHYETVEVERSREVIDGYDYETEYVNNGDGTYSEETVSVPHYTTEYYTDYEEEPVYVDVPVYATKYYYDIERWIVTRTVTTSGGDDEPAWGDPGLSGTEREGDREEYYTLTFTTDKGKTYICDVEEELWQSLQTGDTAKLTITNGDVTKINGEEI